ncbi:MAG: hypothetical protein B6D46_02070 [Polyangiaceae bacterium UTPRO1]|jgi:hypothetical protein|nr:DUF2889 domain-containing protein [Myxococcales bacterium]OQY68908.1 MAG: hypothetical protein B6D46_02070 [Polyangiaceae bacterium UTPRO1]
MREVEAVFHRTKQVSIYPIDGDRFLIEATLQDEVHDVHVEVEILHPALEIVAARSEIRNGPFTAVCNLTHPNMQGLVGMRVARGFTQAARAVVGGVGGCHRVSELLVEVGQAAYQLHFVRFFGSLPPEVRNAPDDPPRRRAAVLGAVPGMRNTCFAYADGNEELVAERSAPLRLREQVMPRRTIE